MHYRTLPGALPHDTTALPYTLPHCRIAAHCRTAVHCHTLPHALTHYATLLDDTARIRAHCRTVAHCCRALPYTTACTAALLHTASLRQIHGRTAAHSRTSCHAHCHILPLTPHCRTLPLALPRTAARTAAHYAALSQTALL
jgi:hypothetical protein